jgi:hypothetical protein
VELFWLIELPFYALSNLAVSILLGMPAVRWPKRKFAAFSSCLGARRGLTPIAAVQFEYGLVEPSGDHESIPMAEAPSLSDDHRGM